MSIRTTVVTAFALTALIAAVPSQAVPNVNVKLRIAKTTYFTNVTNCSLTVAAGSDGATVLEAGKVAGCIQSYVLIATSFGRYLDCINVTGTSICGNATNFWAMRENANVGGVRTPVCPSTDYGIDDFTANEGDELSFTYETAATFLVPGVCPA